MIQVLTQDVIRQHIDRIEPACVADLFALAEAALPAALSADLRAWAARAAREILDIPDGETRLLFVTELGGLPAADIPRGLREAVAALANASQPEVVERIEQVQRQWETVEPASVIPPIPPKPLAPPRVATPAAKKTSAPRAARTPAAMVDPRRAEWIRGDAMERLGAREYAERGLKESILVGGIRHRAPWKDLTEEEVKAELRRLERERRLKHTGERWMVR